MLDGIYNNMRFKKTNVCWKWTKLAHMRAHLDYLNLSKTGNHLVRNDYAKYIKTSMRGIKMKN